MERGKDADDFLGACQVGILGTGVTFRNVMDSAQSFVSRQRTEAP